MPGSEVVEVAIGAIIVFALVGIIVIAVRRVPGAPAHPESDRHIDSCDLEDKGATADEDLPQAEGGVQ